MTVTKLKKLETPEDEIAEMLENFAAELRARRIKAREAVIIYHDREGEAVGWRTINTSSTSNTVGMLHFAAFGMMEGR